MLSIEGEAVLVAFRKHTLLPLDDCLYALRATIPHLTRSSLHRCLQRHGISQPPQVEAERTRRDWEHCAAAAFLLARKLRCDDDMWRVFRRDNLWRRHGELDRQHCLRYALMRVYGASSGRVANLACTHADALDGL